MKRCLVLIVVACGSSPKKQQTLTAEPPPHAEPASLHAQQPGSAAQPGALDAPCKRSDLFGPFELSGEEMLKRRGLGDRLFSDTVSSPEAPIQVCGLRGQLTWLTRLTCDDGSRPWGYDLRKAHAAREGSTMGQRVCGTSVESVPVDIYPVPCPEKRYEVYIDMYECGPGEQFQ